MAKMPVADAGAESAPAISKDSVNYRPGDQMQNCAMCMHFDEKAEWCQAIRDSVKATDVCDLFAAPEDATAPNDLMAQLFGDQYAAG